MAMFLASCETAKQKRFNEAQRQIAISEQVEEVIDKVSSLPEYPQDCKVFEKSRVKSGERLDLALVKTDRALSRANSRVKRCSEWYEDLKKSREGAIEENG